MNNGNIVRVAIYLRVSSEEQKKSGQGLQGQLHDCEKFIESQLENSKIINVYKDEAVSARSTEIYERKQLSKMLNDAKKDLFDCIVVFRADRLYRKSGQAETIISLLEFVGVSLWEANTQKRLTKVNPQEKFQRQIMSSVAELEVEITRERILSTKSAQKANGQFSGGDLPFGFKWDKNTKTVQFIESDIRVWLMIIHKYLVENKGSIVIARELNSDGIPFVKYGLTDNVYSKWKAENVLSLLKNPILTGHFPTNVVHRWVDANGKKRITHNKPSEFIMQKSPLLKEFIPFDMYKAIVEKLEAKRTTKVPPRLHSTSWLLGSLLKCSCCGENMVCVDTGRKNKDGQAYKYYKCQNSECNTSIKSIRKEIIETMVISELRDILKGAEDKEYIMKTAINSLSNESQEIGDSINILQAEIAKYKMIQTKLREDYHSKNDDKYRDIFFEEMAILNEKVKEIENTLSAKQLQQIAKSKEVEEIERVLDDLIKYRADLEEQDEMQSYHKRSILLTLVDNIILTEQGELIITLRSETGNGTPSHLMKSLDRNRESALHEILNGEREASATALDYINKLKGNGKKNTADNDYGFYKVQTHELLHQ